MPDFATFWKQGYVHFGDGEVWTRHTDFRNDPEINPLGTPSGLIEIFSHKIDQFGYDDCKGHPTWMEKPSVVMAALALTSIDLVAVIPTQTSAYTRKCVSRENTARPTQSMAVSLCISALSTQSARHQRWRYSASL